MWRDATTEKSWALLQKLNSEVSFVLIGGWAVYLYTQALKSKDVDMVVSLEELRKLEGLYAVVKNPRLKRYEFLVEGVGVDLYVPFYSDLGVPAEELLRNTTSLSGFTLPLPEYLLITKQKAELERTNSDKGLKDRIDILAMLMRSAVSIENYTKVLSQYKLDHYLRELVRIISNAQEELRQLGMTNPREAKMIRKELLKKVSSSYP